MQELIGLFTQIALLRRGPQDLPASMLLLAVTLLGCACVNALLLAALPVVEGWPPRLAVSLLFTLLWYVALLRLAGRPERILQTTTAVFGLQAVQSAFLLPSEWLVIRAGSDPAWQLPVTLLLVGLLVWVLAAGSHVVQAALEWPAAACVGIVLLEILAEHLVQSSLFTIP